MKILKYLFLLLVFIGVAGFIALKMLSEKMPEGQTGTDADQLADTVMQGLNKTAYEQIPYLSWEFFRPGQKYFWDKKKNAAIIEWDNNKVIMDLNSQKATSFSDGTQQTGDAHEKLKAKAWSNWCNDSFWLIAPYKLKDSGTTRSIVNTEKDGRGLKIEYGSGGVTPGDTYLWLLDENNRPTGWKMWTQILPLQGAYSAWSGWETHGGALLSTSHTILGKNVAIKNLKSGDSYKDFGYDSDPFITQ